MKTMKSSLVSRLDKHFAGAAALSAAAGLAGTAQTADANIVYSGIVNIPIPGDVYGVYLNLVNGAYNIGPQNTPGWDINPYFGANTFYTAAPGYGTVDGGGGNVASLTAGTMIDGTNATSLSSGGALFPTSDPGGYYGFQFQDESNGGAVRYGWARVIRGATTTTAGTIVEYAYEDSGAGILAGATSSGPTGACCVPSNLSCVTTNAAGCANFGGTYFGDGSTCAQANCPTPGACCMTDGSCTQLTSAGCAAANGVYHGDSTACASVSCPQPATGACCLCTSCSILTQAQCATQNGTYAGDNTTCSSTSCPANLVVNPSFETGDTSGWTLTDASSGSLFFIINSSADAHCGNYYVEFGATGGLPDTLSQNIPTTPGAQYTFSFWLDNSYVGGDSMVVSWDNNVVFNQTPTTSAYPWTQFTFVVTASTGSTPISFAGYDGPSYIWLDDVSVVAASSPCYANCDHSTTQPCLNVLDFGCFLNKFAAGDTYANCDNSTTPPVLNVLDFGCFLNKFASGCSSC